MSHIKKLLIADDEPNIRENLNLLFPWDQLHIEVVFLAADGREAYNYILNAPVDFVLADIRMPVMDGLELAQLLQKEHPEISVVLLSAYSDFEYARSAMRCGVLAYLTKPVRYAELIDTFRRLSAMDTNSSETEKNSSATLGRQDETYRGYYQEIVFQIQRYIRENVGSASLIGAAQYTGLSPSYVSTLFHRFLGKTFSEYLTMARMEQADCLLNEGWSISDISWAVGYNNPNNFIRAYRQYTKRDPLSRPTAGKIPLFSKSTRP